MNMLKLLSCIHQSQLRPFQDEDFQLTGPIEEEGILIGEFTLDGKEYYWLTRDEGTLIVISPKDNTEEYQLRLTKTL